MDLYFIQSTYFLSHRNPLVFYLLKLEDRLCILQLSKIEAQLLLLDYCSDKIFCSLLNALYNCISL